jgi:hypothetical protein
MTEAEWMAFTDPRPMLGFLRGRASDRKLRLFAVACCRRMWDLLPDERCRSAFETAERFADGLASLDSIREARQGALLSFDSYSDHDESGRFTGQESAAAAVAGACWAEVEDQYRELDAVVDNCYGLGRLSSGWRNGGRIEYLGQCRDIRDIFGDPFQTLDLAPSWLTSEVVEVAHTMYDARAFDRMPILGDALEDAGCADAAILAHCRDRVEHVRGCWVVDALLGKQ